VSVLHHCCKHVRTQQACCSFRVERGSVCRRAGHSAETFWAVYLLVHTGSSQWTICVQHDSWALWPTTAQGHMSLAVQHS
jgi:hypothetical protein